MKNILIFLSGVLVAGLLIFGVGFAYAQTQTPPENVTPQGDFPRGMSGRYFHGPGMMGQYSNQLDGTNFGLMHDFMLQAFAEMLNLTPDELQVSLDSGLSMWQIVQGQGISQVDFYDFMLQARTKAIEQALQAGTITQSWADQMLQHMSQVGNRGFGFGGCRGGVSSRTPGGKWNSPTTAP